MSVVAMTTEKASASSSVRIWCAIDQHRATKRPSPDVGHRRRPGGFVRLLGRARHFISSHDWREHDRRNNFHHGATGERPGRLDRGQLVAARRHGRVPQYQNWCGHLSHVAS